MFLLPTYALPTTEMDWNPVVANLLLNLSQAVQNNYPMIHVVNLASCGEPSVVKSEHLDIKPINNEDQPSTSAGTSEQGDAQRKRVFDKPCAVCGGAASGYHYETPSCNSCKTFFRRTVISGKLYKCIKGDGRCLAVARVGAKIKCRQCRFEKCVREGMRPETVSTSKEAGSGLLSMASIKQEIPDSPVDSRPVSGCSSSGFEMQLPIGEGWMGMARSVAALSEIDEKIKALRCSDFDPFAYDIGVLYLLEHHSILEQVHLFNKVKEWRTQPRISQSRKTLYPTEFCRDIAEWLTIDLIGAIEYMKRFALFRTMTTIKQCEVIRRNALPLAIAHQCFDSIVRGHQMIVMPDGSSPMSVVPGASYERHSNNDTFVDALQRHANTLDKEQKTTFQRQIEIFVTVLDPFMRDKVDHTEYLLIKAILFHECMLQVESTSDYMEDRSKYTKYLFEYLRSKCLKTAPARFLSILSLTQLLIIVASKHKNQILAAETVHNREQDRMIKEVVLGEMPGPPTLSTS